jgi:hypothetical protein
MRSTGTFKTFGASIGRSNDWTQSVIDTFYSKAVSMGADAVMHFAISQYPSVEPSGLVAYYYEVTGFAIKRKSLK